MRKVGSRCAGQAGDHDAHFGHNDVLATPHQVASLPLLLVPNTHAPKVLHLVAGIVQACLAHRADILRLKSAAETGRAEATDVANAVLDGVGEPPPLSPPLQGQLSLSAVLWSSVSVQTCRLRKAFQ